MLRVKPLPMVNTSHVARIVKGKNGAYIANKQCTDAWSNAVPVSAPVQR